jgi:hypothetical protein
MGRILASSVHLFDGRSFAAGDEVPDDVAEQITNPAVWVDGDTDEVSPGAAHEDSDGSDAAEQPAGDGSRSRPRRASAKKPDRE